MKVLKFGGSSVSNTTNILKVTSILQKESKNTPIVVIVSALGGTTDMLLNAGEQANCKNNSYLDTFNAIVERHHNLASELNLNEHTLKKLDTKLEKLKQILQGIYLLNEFSDKTKDKVQSFGEILSSLLISESLITKGLNCQLKDSRELIVTDSAFTKAEVDFDITNSNIETFFKANPKQITIVPGFISRNKNGETTTLGRDGSDYSAAIYAGALKADSLEIWTDVSGMYTANPKLVKQAFPVKGISYHEAMELSHFGSSVLYPPSVKPVLDNNIPMRIKNTFNPDDDGTLISNDAKGNKGAVKGISHLSNISLLTLEGTGLSAIKSVANRLFESLSNANVNVILITQASSEFSICIAIDTKDNITAENAVNKAFAYEITLQKLKPAIIETNLAIVAVVGEKMKSHQGISGKMFSALGENNVNIRAIAQGASERNISAVIDNHDAKKALNVLHTKFFEQQIQTLNIFIVGVGNVGNKLINQIHQQHQYILDNLLIDMRITGLSNSKKMLFNESGIDLSDWENKLKDGVEKTEATWFETIKNLNLRNSVFVDVTANEDIASTYSNYLKESIAVVACNKIACSSEYANYQLNKELSKKYNASYLFETNVGAALPIISTLHNLVNSGDKVTSIKAVLSGSLNFIFNNFNANTSFYDVVKLAAKEGYTEPDPRIDLSGVDVARKILILARESGYKLNLEDITNNSFLPQTCLDAKSVPDFYESLKTETAHFDAIYKSANANNTQLKYVAEFTNGKASVSLQEVDKSHPFYNLDGKDNIVLFYTQRYADQPLIIKGAGAGADVTASGLFGDIISLVKK